jgi:hypothetical protein
MYQIAQNYASRKSAAETLRKLNAYKGSTIMKTRLFTLSAGLGLALFALSPLAWSQADGAAKANAATPPADADEGVFDQLSAVTQDVTELKKQEGVEPQLKGPVHEAFFADSVTEPKASQIVTKDPPADLEELPPADKPEGDDIQWYSGYWEFDQERNDFTWVSGIYRKPPPKRQWIAGHWVKVDGGWQRQRGLWMTLDQAEITFLSTAPPEAPVEEAANNPPDDKSVFVPGHQEPKPEGGFTFKPGKWVPMQPNWIWVPSHYVWTPCGYVFVKGYWDYVVEKRGLLYAPVCVDLAYVKPGWTYTPTCVVHNTCLLDNLFVKPGCGYFFGAYHKNKSYTCWPDVCNKSKACDPLFAHYKCQNKHQGNWEGNLRAQYSGRRNGTVSMPPSNLKELGKFVQDFKNKSVGANQVRQNMLVGHASKLNTNLLKIRTLDNAGVQSQKKFSDQLRNAGRSLANSQSQHLRSRIGSQNGSSPFKFNVDKSLNNHFRGFNRSTSNGNNQIGSSGAKIGSGSNLGNILGGNRGSSSNGNNQGTGQFLRNGNNSQGNNGNGGKNLGSVLGGSNGAKVLQGNGSNQGNNSAGNNSSRFNQSGNNASRILQNGNNNGSGSNSVIRNFQGSNNSSNNFRNIQGNNSSNNVIRNFQGNNSNNNNFRSIQGNNNGSNFRSIQGSGSGSNFSQRSFQSNGSFNGGSGNSSFKSFGGSSGGNRSGGGGGGGGGGRRGR